jgi:lysine 2,3-aminomutase
VIDAPGGGGKVPINPEYIESINDDEIVFRNYEGKQFQYPIKDGAARPPANKILPIEASQFVD